MSKFMAPFTLILMFNLYHLVPHVLKYHKWEASKHKTYTQSFWEFFRVIWHIFEWLKHLIPVNVAQSETHEIFVTWILRMDFKSKHVFVYNGFQCFICTTQMVFCVPFRADLSRKLFLNFDLFKFLEFG